MPWELQYYSESVRREIEEWPVGIRAMYARITERMEVFGPHLGMSFTRPMGDGLFEIRASGQEGIGRALFYIPVGHSIMILHVFICSRSMQVSVASSANTGRLYAFAWA